MVDLVKKDIPVSPSTVDKKEEVVEGIKADPGKVDSIVVTKEEVQFTPRKVADTLMSLDEIRAIPKEHMPIIMYCDGGSIFGTLIRIVDKSAASHAQLLYGVDKIASQWFYFTTFNVDHLKSYNCKLIWNSKWTPEQRQLMIDLIELRLALPHWQTRYDVWGVIGQGIGWKWLQRRGIDFCSEAVARVLKVVDPALVEWSKTCPSPTPREINIYTKSHKELGYEVYGRYIVDDDLPPNALVHAPRV
jgi:hypothetical protein